MRIDVPVVLVCTLSRVVGVVEQRSMKVVDACLPGLDCGRYRNFRISAKSEIQNLLVLQEPSRWLVSGDYGQSR
jgi:hypothetical protein